MAIGFKTNSVETRLVGVLLMLTVLPTITVGWIAHEILLDHIKTEKLVDMGRVAEAKHDQLSMVLSRANGRADLFLSDLAAQCGFGTLDRTCAARLMRSYLIAENALSATLHLKGSGGPLTVGSRAVRHDADPKFNAGQLAAFDGQGPEGNRVYFIRATEQISGLRLEISYPSSSLQSIFDRPEELGESGETFLADGRGYFVTQARYPTTQGVNDPINTAPYQACLGGGSGEMLDLDYRNAKVIHGFRPVPELGSACIMAHIGQAEAFAPLRKLEKDWLVASMLFLAFALVVARNVSRRIANPLINLTKIASAYTQGHYTAQADVKGRNEIAELASAFNSMTYQLTSANDLLAEKVVELEEARAGMARTNRALKMQLLCNIKLVYADAEDTLLEEVCKLIVNAGGYRMAWVGFAQHDEEYTVLPAAQSGFDEGYLESLRITWSDTELGQGPTGAAIRTGATQINQDFQTNAPMTPWRESALARGYRSSIALPLRNGGETFGALTIYSEEADAFNSGEAGLLEDLANELAFGILMQRLRVRNKQAEEALQRSEEKFRLVVEHIPMRIFIKDINSVYVSCNELCARDWGLAPSAIAGMTDFDFHPRELAKQYRADDERVMRSGQTVEIERKYLIGGKELFAHTIKVPFRDKDGRMVGVLGILWDVTERKLAEERLRRSEHDLAEAQSMAHLGSWSLDLISNELTWSDENYRIFGFERGEFGASYEAFLDVVHPDDREFVNQAYTSSLKDRKPYDIVHRLLMKDGRVKYVNERCETYYSDAGEPVRSIGTTHDITQLKLVEQNLLAVQNELTSTLNAIPDLLFEIGLDGRYYSYRSPRTDLLAAPPEQLIGSLVSDVLPPEASAVCLAALQEANEAGHSSGRQFELKLGDEIKWFELSISRKTREKTDDPRFIVISRDITERKRVEQSLLTLYKAIDQSPISVIITDADARIQYINPHFTTMSGYTAAEVLGKNPSMFKSEQTPDEVYADMWSKISSGQIWHGELLNKNKSGQLYSEETHIAPVMDAAGKVSQYVCLKIDNSERIEAEEKLAESYLELQRLSSHLEHLREDERAKIARDLHDEMGALLVALKMRVAWLASKLPADMPLLTEETGHISTLTADLISSMHQIVTELRPNLQEGFGFVATFEDYVKKFQQRTGIECRFALPEEEMKLDTNRAVSLFRILQESLNNVEKYSMAKRVKILLTAKNDSLSLVVEDNGVGFDPAMRKKGSFGLIGIRERTAMMGGKAKISSTPGKGTKVSVTLPQV